MIYLVSKTTKEHFDAATFSPEDANDADLTFVEADDNGWVPHKGDECPVPKNSRVQVRYALGNGPSRPITRPQNYSWRQDGHLNGRIVAYRPVLEDKSEESSVNTPVLDSICALYREMEQNMRDDKEDRPLCDSAVKGQVTVSADEPEMPRLGDKYVHRNGNVYRVTGFANAHTERPDEYPVTVIYQGAIDGKVWCRPLKDWARSFVPDKEVEALAQVLSTYYTDATERVRPLSEFRGVARALYLEGYRKVERRRDEKG